MTVRFRQAFVSATVMICAAMAMGMVFNVTRPSGIPFVGDWSSRALTRIYAGDLEVVGPEGAFDLFSQGQALFIDARDPDSFSSGHIPGAVNITPEDADARLEEIRSLLKNGKTLIAYCYDIDCPLGAELVRKLRDLGAGPIMVMPEGWTGWMDRGYPHE